MTPDINLIFGRNVNRLRMRRGLTQDQVIERADISRRYFQRIERGGENPTLRVIVALCQALEATWDELLRGMGWSFRAPSFMANAALLADLPPSLP